MKKVISFMLILTLFCGVFAITSLAAPKDDVKEKLLASKFSESVKYFEVTMDNVLSQITITEDQATKLIALIDEADANVASDKGHSIHLYNEQEQAFFMAKFKEACNILGLTYTISIKGVQGQDHEHDMIYTIYKDGKKIADLDGDVVKQTGGSTSTLPLIAFCGFALIIGAGITFILNKKLLLK